MARTHEFHPQVGLEVEEAYSYYLEHASFQVAERFLALVKIAVRSLLAHPTRWRVVQEPAIRRMVLQGFPFVIYYRWEEAAERVFIYSVMHTSREPGYWHDRLD